MQKLNSKIIIFNTERKEKIRRTIVYVVKGGMNRWTKSVTGSRANSKNKIK
jgi:hypothetical protein